MSTEANRATLVNHLQKNVEWRYPLSGVNQYDFNPGTGVFVMRRGEPADKNYPTVVISFLPRNDIVIDGLGQVLKYESGGIVNGFIGISPVIISVYTNQITPGTNGKYHGKLVADAYIRRIERYIHRYWPKLLNPMEAAINYQYPFIIDDISRFEPGDERQGFELTFHLETVTKWHYYEDSYTGVVDESYEPSEYFFEDATLSGDQYDGNRYSIYLSVSGEMYDKE